MAKKRARAKVKITRREMKRDPLVTFSLKAADFIKRNARIISIVAVVIVATVLIVVLMGRDRARAESEASVILAQANRALYGRGSTSEALTLYDELLDRYAGTKSGKKGLLFRGDALLQEGRQDEAIESYQRFLSREKKDTLLRNSAQKGIATAYEDKGEFAKAANVHETLALNLSENEAAEELMSAARCYRAAAMYGNAIGVYEKVLSNYPDYWGVQQAKVFLEELRMKLKLAAPSAGD